MRKLKEDALMISVEAKQNVISLHLKILPQASVS